MPVPQSPQARKAAALARLRASHGVGMVYVRHSTGSRLAVTGHRTRPKTVGTTSHGVVVVTHDDDILIAAAELHEDGVRFEPAKNDRLEEQLGNSLLIWETKPAAGSSRNGDVFHWSDTGRTQARCHVQCLKTIEGPPTESGDNSAGDNGLASGAAAWARRENLLSVTLTADEEYTADAEYLTQITDVDVFVDVDGDGSRFAKSTDGFTVSLDGTNPRRAYVRSGTNLSVRIALIGN